MIRNTIVQFAAFVIAAWLLTYAVIGWRGVVSLAALCVIAFVALVIRQAFRVDADAIRRALGL
jgi:hypothetical protein